MSGRDQDGTEFGKLAMALGFLTPADMEKALRLQTDLAKLGVTKRLGEILLEKKILSREQVLLILRAQGKRILSCHTCKKSYNVHHYRPYETYSCKHCSTKLAIPNKPVSTNVNDSITMATTVFEAEEVKPSKSKAKAKPKPAVPADLVHLLSGYEIVERIGQGGMGTVYKARDTIMGRWVAVKLLAPFLADDKEYIKRFFQEARNLQKLHHPNIVAAFDAGIAGEHKFFIMEYVNGPSVEQVMHSKGVLSEHNALEITRQVAQALDYAWTNTIIHRDIKPQNVMLSDGKTVKLCDLGLSKDVTSDFSLTMTGSVNCSPPYASPEQAQGLKGIDVRSDVYSLGVMLFQMCCGELPFKGGSPGQFLIAHVTEKPPNPLSRNPRLSPQTGKLILRLLEKEPERRPMPGELAKVLTKFLNGVSLAGR
ncbi:MAG TPA: serine/threonine-protein kinase [Planctomycetota bacterium]|nr:serine/threonine-protein kinase [Planctomycetota bacterium]